MWADDQVEFSNEDKSKVSTSECFNELHNSLYKLFDGLEKLDKPYAIIVNDWYDNLAKGLKQAKTFDEYQIYQQGILDLLNRIKQDKRLSLTEEDEQLLAQCRTQLELLEENRKRTLTNIPGVKRSIAESLFLGGGIALLMVAIVFSAVFPVILLPSLLVSVFALGYGVIEVGKALFSVGGDKTFVKQSRFNQVLLGLELGASIVGLGLWVLGVVMAVGVFSVVPPVAIAIGVVSLGVTLFVAACFIARFIHMKRRVHHANQACNAINGKYETQLTEAPKNQPTSGLAFDEVKSSSPSTANPRRRFLSFLRPRRHTRKDRDTAASKSSNQSKTEDSPSNSSKSGSSGSNK